MSEFETKNFESLEAQLTPPLSRVAVYTSPDEVDRVLLRFIDIPHGEEHDIDFLINSEFFSHFSFQLWNASQPKTRTLMRYPDIEQRGVWLFSDAEHHDVPIVSQAQELISQYVASGETTDGYAETRVQYIRQAIHEYLADLPEADRT